MIKQYDANKARVKRHGRLRRKLAGTAAKPRLSVFRSNKHIYAQLIDDDRGITIAAASSSEAALKLAAAAAVPQQGEEPYGIAGVSVNHKVSVSREVGRILAERAKSAGVTTIVFDRSGYLYHGRVAAVAVGAREGGLEF